MSLSGDDLQRVVQTVWSTQLGFELEVADSADLAPMLSEENTVLTSIHFAGDFTGRLEQRCSHHVSLSAAAAAFSGTGNELGNSDIRDTVAEMAHMTAGNLKSILAQNCEVRTPDHHESSSGQDSIIAEAAFTFEGEPLIVDVIQEDC